MDLAVKGLKEERFLKVNAKLMRSLERSFDLIDLDDKNDRFGDFIIKNMVLIRVL